MLSPFLAAPSRLAPGLLSLLRLGAYELLVCERPGRITNDYVQLAKQLSHARASGLVNGTVPYLTLLHVLRAHTRSADSIAHAPAVLVA